MQNTGLSGDENDHWGKAGWLGFKIRDGERFQERGKVRWCRLFFNAYERCWFDREMKPAFPCEGGDHEKYPLVFSVWLGWINESMYAEPMAKYHLLYKA